MTTIGATPKSPANTRVRASLAPVLERDARDRYEELRRAARCLWPDRDDTMVLSELLVVMRELHALEDEFGRRCLRPVDPVVGAA